MPAKKKTTKKGRRTAFVMQQPIAPAATVIGIAKSVTDQLVGAAAAWTEIRNIASAELARLAGK